MNERTPITAKFSMRSVTRFGRWVCLALLVCAAGSRTSIWTFGAQTKFEWSSPEFYTGMCDASAAVAVDSRFFIVADDEGNKLRVYDRQRSGAPLQVFDLTAALELDPKSPETDIEGGARVGDEIYWITSHARNHFGKAHPNRYRFFATRLSITNDHVQLSFIGRPYTRLLDDLERAPSLRTFGFAAASALMPKLPGALNIEALSATAAGDLLIGFRNPIPGGKALLVPLKNPHDLLRGKRAEFGDPILLELQGLGIRDMAFADGKYLIIGGSFDGAGRSRIFSWEGIGTDPKALKDVYLKGLNPEAFVIYPDQGLRQFQLLSDDGKRQRGGLQCKDVADDNAKRFRSVWVTQQKQETRKSHHRDR